MTPQHQTAARLLWLAAFVATTSTAWADHHRASDQLTKTCRDTVIVGRSGAWDTIWNGAQRNARIRWRQEVRATPTFGRGWDDWGLANRDVPFSDCHDGYCCRTKRIAGVKWHQCSAYAQPCRIVDVPRDGEVTPPPPRRTGTALVVESTSLVAERVSAARQCPAIVMLRATVTATGSVGSVRLRLQGDQTSDTVILDASDFETTPDGTLTATHSFRREFQGPVDRGYTLSVSGATRWGDAPRRVTPTHVELDCRRAGDRGLATPDQPH